MRELSTGGRAFIHNIYAEPPYRMWRGCPAAVRHGGSLEYAPHAASPSRSGHRRDGLWLVPVLPGWSVGRPV